MRFVTTTRGIGTLDAGEVALLDTDLATLDEALRAGPLTDLTELAVREVVPYADLEVLAPVTEPRTVVIVGLNYPSHAGEVALPVPEEVLFTTLPGAGRVTPPDGTVVLPASNPDQVDYEGEIAVVIGAPADHVPAAEAWDHVAGLTAANDISARDVQMEALAAGETGPTQADAKGFPTFKPLGPVLVTIEDPDSFDIGISTTVNGELRQSAQLSDLVFGVPQIIEAVTAQVALEPGDVICTGSPDGVGFASGRFLAAGDVIEVRLGDLPALRTVIAAPANP